MLRKSVFILLTIIFCQIIYAGDSKSTIYVDEYLVLGPIKVTSPVESKSEDLNSIITYSELDIKNWWPGEGDLLFVYANSTLDWKKVSKKELNFEKEKNPVIYYAGFYIETNRYIDAEIESKTCQLASLFLNSKKKTEKTTLEETQKNKCEPGKLTSKLEIEYGKHFVLIKLLFDPSKNSEWLLTTSITLDKKHADNISVNTNPKRTTTISDLLDNKNVTSISLSPNGELVALKMRERNQSKNSYDNWIELRNVKDGSLRWTFKGGLSIPEVDWAPDSKSFAYTTTSGEEKTLWVVDLENGTTESLLENVKNMGGFTWAKNGQFIVYTVTEKAKEEDSNFKKYELPEDRWPGFRDKQFIYRVFVKSKMKERLTAGEHSTSFLEISPDSEKILFTKSFYGEQKRPYSRTDYYILHLETMQADSILSLFYSSSASWSPDSKQLLILGGSSVFGRVGNNLPEDIIPNDYDTQAYIYDIASKEVKAISKDFKPQISNAEWDGKHNVIYLSTTDQSYSRLYRYDLTTNNYELIDLQSESLSTIDFSDDYSTAIFKASSSNIPEKVYKLDLLTGNVELFLEPEADQYKNIILGDVKNWDFVSSEGEKIKGRIYYPPNFDKSKKHPAIVYYYGGTSPVGRDFGGRYPKNVWAANGYVVYVLQPSGATGFGTEFSAKHVNDWGTTTAQEVIEGTKKFLIDHQFVDPNRVGCIGASYGGFMTMNIITKTEMFSAAISHAGISNLASYWGVGYWGYLYNSVAGAESFPWNAPEEYVDKSPLYNADKVNTPLLMLHGNSDPNVPPGESMQMFVALKLLGKDVELIEVDKQEHWILDYDKRTKWSKTILAYFDKYLKGQPEWWESLYK